MKLLFSFLTIGIAQDSDGLGEEKAGGYYSTYQWSTLTTQYPPTTVATPTECGVIVASDTDCSLHGANYATYEQVQEEWDCAKDIIENRPGWGKWGIVAIANGGTIGGSGYNFGHNTNDPNWPNFGGHFCTQVHPLSCDNGDYSVWYGPKISKSGKSGQNFIFRDDIYSCKQCSFECSKLDKCHFWEYRANNDGEGGFEGKVYCSLGLNTMLMVTTSHLSEEDPLNNVVGIACNWSGDSDEEFGTRGSLEKRNPDAYYWNKCSADRGEDCLDSTVRWDQKQCDESTCYCSDKWGSMVPGTEDVPENVTCDKNMRPYPSVPDPWYDTILPVIRSLGELVEEIPDEDINAIKRSQARQALIHIQETMLSDFNNKKTLCGKKYSCDVADEEIDDEQTRSSVECDQMEKGLKMMRRWTKTYNCPCTYERKPGKFKTLRDITKKVKRLMNKPKRIMGRALCD